MKPFGRKYNAKILPQNDVCHLWLDETQPEIVCRFAFVKRGTETPIFPAFILDDWGEEIRGSKMFRWVRDNGELFPRAEIFGFDDGGTSVQLFVRELELYYKPLCFAFADGTMPITDGCRVEAVLLTDATLAEATSTPPPAAEMVDALLRRAKVSWWRTPPLTENKSPIP